MHALKPSYQDLQPVRRTRTVPRTQVRKQRDPHRVIAIEASIKLSVNLLVSTAAVFALVQLIPYRATQVSKLQELEVALQSTKERLQLTQNNFSQYFDPSQTKAVMQQQSVQLDRSQHKVVWREASPGRP